MYVQNSFCDDMYTFLVFCNTSCSIDNLQQSNTLVYNFGIKKNIYLKPVWLFVKYFITIQT